MVSWWHTACTTRPTRRSKVVPCTWKTSMCHQSTEDKASRPRLSDGSPRYFLCFMRLNIERIVHTVLFLFTSTGWANSLTSQKLSVCQCANHSSTNLTTTHRHFLSCMRIHTILPRTFLWDISNPRQLPSTSPGQIHRKISTPEKNPP